MFAATCTDPNLSSYLQFLGIYHDIANTIALSHGKVYQYPGPSSLLSELSVIFQLPWTHLQSLSNDRFLLPVNLVCQCLSHSLHISRSF